jgi:hypothetical protein
MQWHDYLTLVLLSAAAVVVLVRAYQFFSAKSAAGCGSGCGSCPSGKGQEPSPGSLLTIGDRPNPKC